MTKLIAKAILGKRERGEIGYYRRLKRVERNINNAIGTVILSLAVGGFYSWLFIAWLIYG